jgi:hypothetical protein
MLTTVLLVLLIAVLIAGLPNAPWGAWHSLGPYPSGLAFVLLVVVVGLLLIGRL